MRFTGSNSLHLRTGAANMNYYNSSATPNTAIPAITMIINTYGILLSFSLRNSLDSNDWHDAVGRTMGATITALSDMA